MKAGKEHRVPLSHRALAIVRELAEIRQSVFIFPGDRENQPLSNMALLMTLRRVQSGITVDGFRSTFRDWAAEHTNFPREIAEAALAHVLQNKAEAAYQRGDLLQKRRKLMDAWERFCNTTVARPKIIQLAMLA
jgi:integrase